MSEVPSHRFLIVEDDLADAELLTRQLRRDGFAFTAERVDTEADYAAALGGGCDLILSDYRLPRFTGLRALELLRQSGRDIPFILVSGTIGEEIAVQAMQAGAADYLLKDRLARLGPAVRHALEQARLRRERVRAESDLAESERRLRDMLSNVDLVALMLDREGRVTFCNGYLLRLTGWSAEEVLAQDYFTRFVPEPADRRRQSFLEGIALGRVVPHLEVLIKTRSGALREIAWNNTVLRDTSGAVIGIASLGNDVTEQKMSAKLINDQLAELLRWQEVMLDREGRVQALKQEVNDLLARQGQPPRYPSASPS
jgi:PAS domain S-box-containing protein